MYVVHATRPPRRNKYLDPIVDPKRLDEILDKIDDLSDFCLHLIAMAEIEGEHAGFEMLMDFADSIGRNKHFGRGDENSLVLLSGILVKASRDHGGGVTSYTRRPH